MTAISVKAVIIEEGRVLLLANDRGEWELPGGRLDPGESESAALLPIVEGVYEHLDEIKGPKRRENLANHRDDAFRSRELGTIVRDIPFEACVDTTLAEEAMN